MFDLYGQPLLAAKAGGNGRPANPETPLRPAAENTLASEWHSRRSRSRPGWRQSPIRRPRRQCDPSDLEGLPRLAVARRHANAGCNRADTRRHRGEAARTTRARRRGPSNFWISDLVPDEISRIRFQPGPGPAGRVGAAAKRRTAAASFASSGRSAAIPWRCEAMAPIPTSRERRTTPIPRKRQPRPTPMRARQYRPSPPSACWCCGPSSRSIRRRCRRGRGSTPSTTSGARFADGRARRHGQSSLVLVEASPWQPRAICSASSLSSDCGSGCTTAKTR